MPLLFSLTCHPQALSSSAAALKASADPEAFSESDDEESFHSKISDIIKVGILIMFM